MKSTFPTYTQNAKKGELGVSLVSSIIADSFGWLFKRNHQEHDFGVDGQVEFVSDRGHVTGQMFAVQIKYGSSFFTEENKWGYIFRGEAKHFNYLANYPVPVLICICNPDSQQCYWVKFVPELTQATDKGWMITVPFENVLATSKGQLEALMPNVRDAATELQIYWAMNNVLTTTGAILFGIERRDVELRRFASPRAFFDRLRSTKELAYACQGKVEISFSGYDDDPRELFEIEEVRKYVAQLDKVLEDLFFFVRTEEPTHTLKIFVECQAEVRWHNGRKQVSVNTRSIAEFLHRHWPALNELTNWLGMSVEENKKICFAVMRCLNLEPPEEA